MNKAQEVEVGKLREKITEAEDKHKKDLKTLNDELEKAKNQPKKKKGLFS